MRKFLKWTGGILGGLLVLLALFLAWTYVSVEQQINKTYDIDVEPIAVTRADSTLLARGEHLSYIYGCRECHGADLSGQILVDAPPFRVVAKNLTPGRGGIGDTYTTEDWIRAIRHGVAGDGTPIMIMPSQEFAHIGKEDLTALIAYLESLPPIDNELPPTEIRLLGRVIIKHAGANLFYADEIDHEAPIQPAPEPTPTAAYGNYLYNIVCTDCHGANFQGGPHPDPAGPPVPALTAAAVWPTEAFRRTLRTGVTPGKVELDPKYMPWQAFRHMTDEEITALHRYLQVEAVPN